MLSILIRALKRKRIDEINYQSQFISVLVTKKYELKSNSLLKTKYSVPRHFFIKESNKLFFGVTDNYFV